MLYTENNRTILSILSNIKNIFSATESELTPYLT